MEDVASISASPVHRLLPADAVGGLLVKQFPELGLVVCGQSNVSLCQVDLQRVVESESRSPAPTSSALWDECDHFAHGGVLTAQCVTGPTQSIPRKLL